MCSMVVSSSLTMGWGRQKPIKTGAGSSAHTIDLQIQTIDKLKKEECRPRFLLMSLKGEKEAEGINQHIDIKDMA